jgi:hypothetical protein
MQKMALWRLVDGKLHEGWFQADMLGLRVQLGVLPPPRGGSAEEGR